MQKYTTNATLFDIERLLPIQITQRDEEPWLIMSLKTQYKDRLVDAGVWEMNVEAAELAVQYLDAFINSAKALRSLRGKKNVPGMVDATSPNTGSRPVE